ncbi:MAG: hypothetical protein QXI16_04560 [Sulfolobaceae archaeon]
MNETEISELRSLIADEWQKLADRGKLLRMLSEAIDSYENIKTLEYYDIFHCEHERVTDMNRAKELIYNIKGLL